MFSPIAAPAKVSLPQDVPLVIVTVPFISLDKSPTHLNPTTTFVLTLTFPDVYEYTVISPEPPALFCVPMLIVLLNFGNL